MNQNTECNVVDVDSLKTLTKGQLIDLIVYEFTATSVVRMPSGPKGPGRKEQVLALLQNGPVSSEDIAKKLSISTKNVASQISYLKDDGKKIGKDPDQKYVLWPEA